MLEEDDEEEVLDDMDDEPPEDIDDEPPEDMDNEPECLDNWPDAIPEDDCCDDIDPDDPNVREDNAPERLDENLDELEPLDIVFDDFDIFDPELDNWLLPDSNKC